MTRIPRPFSLVTGSGRRAQWRRRVLRRVLSAGLAACAVVLATSAARPAAGPTVLVLVAAREVPAGAVLAEGDVRPARVPGGAAQPGAITSPSEALGRRVAAGLVTGEALTASRLVPRAAVDGLPPGRVALHVVAADPASVDLAVDATPLEELGADLLEIDVGPGSKIAGVRVFELRLPVGANVSLVVRGGTSFVPRESDVLRHGDQVLIVAPQAVRDDTEKRLQAVSRGGRLAGW